MAPKKTKEQYFTKATEDAIVLYNKTEDQVERNRIYSQYIHKAFDKLVENMIHTFKFYQFDVPYEDVKHDVIAHLNEKMYKYTDPEKGKAFSYFSIIAKNYLILHNNANYRKTRISDDPIEIDNTRNIASEVARAENSADLVDFIDKFIEYIDDRLPSIFMTKPELDIADSVIELFRTRENIENFNKKALYILIRDRSGQKTQSITKVINTIHDIFSKAYCNYVKFGYILEEDELDYIDYE